jgi:myo-inositol-1(or 4)-monophosphatase
MTTTNILEFAKQLARETGKQILADRQANLTTSFKAGEEMVTNADINADRLIMSRIKAAYPEHHVLSEEGAPDLSLLRRADESLWIVDPIDGTVNFAHGHSQSAVSLAYVENSQLSCGVVYNPFTDEMFSAEKGGGAYLNGEPIEVAGERELRKAVIATGFPYIKSNLGPLIRRVENVLTQCADIRRLGSAALDICWVAMGRLDGYYESLSVWDFAAAQLIAKEAGAQYGHFSLVPKDIDPQFYDQDILIANPVLYPKLLKVLQEAEHH